MSESRDGQKPPHGDSPPVCVASGGEGLFSASSALVPRTLILATPVAKIGDWRAHPREVYHYPHKGIFLRKERKGL
jgi:hypothetical protein